MDETTAVEEPGWGTADQAYEDGRDAGWAEAVEAALVLLRPWPDAVTMVAGLCGGPPRDMPPSEPERSR